MVVLGWINLLGLNLGGLLFLWFASRLRERNNRFRIATIVVLGLYSLLSLSMVPWLYWRGTAGTRISLYSLQWLNPPYWLCWGFLVTFSIVHGLPVYWLTRPGTRFAFEHCVEIEAGQYCPNCQFNLTGNESGVCPDCGLILIAPRGLVTPPTRRE